MHELQPRFDKAHEVTLALAGRPDYWTLRHP